MAAYYDFIDSLLLITSLIIFFSSLDDLFIDICYWGRRAYRHFFVKNRHKPVTLEALKSKTEQPIAIMVPAWQESAVIAQMLEANLRFIDYRNYFFFVGVYQNDPLTIAEVDKMVARYPNIRKVDVPHDGPTCKADCLNWIIQAIFLHEKKTGLKFSMMVMHDSEDAIHPLELSLFNYLVPRKDLIQLPVRCLESKQGQFVRGTYIDEFSEFHSKDMVVREALVGIVPSAGVASCFSRKAIAALCDKSENQPFNTDTLTEDYDISYRLAQHQDMHQVFVTFPVSVSITKELYPRSHANNLDREVPIATGEYFPCKLWDSIRQKTRWNIGIFFQAASLTTWKGGIFHKYYFLHDRKGILTNLVMFPAYFLLVNIIVFRLGGNLMGWPYYIFDLPPWLVVSNFCLLLNRALQRAYFTTNLYNWKQGVLSVPRIACSNMINFSATARASWLYMRSLISGKKIAWDKTTHEYPSLEVLTRRYKKLGDLLKEKNLVGKSQLEEALREQKICRLPLGQVLINKRLLGEDDLLDILCSQTNYSKGEPDNVSVDAAIKLLPTDLILTHEIFPKEVFGQKVLTLLSATAISEKTRDAILSQGYLAINPQIILESDMERLLELVRRKIEDRKFLGEMLLEKRLISSDSLSTMLAGQREKTTPLGTMLVNEGMVTVDQLVGILAEQLGYQTGQVDRALPVKEALEVIHPSIMINNKIYPVQVGPVPHRLTLFTARKLNARSLDALEAWGYSDIVPLLVRDSDMQSLLDEVRSYMLHETRGSARGFQPPATRRLGDILRHRGVIDWHQLHNCLNDQKNTNRQLGAILLDKGFITDDELNEALTQQRAI